LPSKGRKTQAGWKATKKILYLHKGTGQTEHREALRGKIGTDWPKEENGGYGGGGGGGGGGGRRSWLVETGVSVGKN